MRNFYFVYIAKYKVSGNNNQAKSDAEKQSIVGSEINDGIFNYYCIGVFDNKLKAQKFCDEVEIKSQILNLKRVEVLKNNLNQFNFVEITERFFDEFSGVETAQKYKLLLEKLRKTTKNNEIRSLITRSINSINEFCLKRNLMSAYINQAQKMFVELMFFSLIASNSIQIIKN
ncbi:MAG: hypothetical protein IJ538_04585 [Clostridia bacterium]|nr:hypothetical protein [Clostridia bacterium]